MYSMYNTYDDCMADDSNAVKYSKQSAWCQVNTNFMQITRVTCTCVSLDNALNYRSRDSCLFKNRPPSNHSHADQVATEHVHRTCTLNNR